MVGTPRPSNKRPRPSPGEAFARAKAAAGPRIEAATAAAAPKMERAAQTAGGFLSTLRDRAKETAKGFSDGYSSPDDDAATVTDGDERPAATSRPRPRPRAD